MKISEFALCGLTLAVAAAVALPVWRPGVAHAQAATAPTKFCVIQAEAALVNTKDGQAAVAELEKTLSPKKTALQKQQGDLQEMQQVLQKGANTMSQTAKDEQTRKIDSANKKFQRDVEDYNAEADNAQRKMLDGLTPRMKQVIDLYAKDHGCAVVFNVADQNTPIVYVADSSDITTAVVDMYDKTQSVSKAPPAKSGAPPAGVRPAATPPALATPAPPPAAPPKQ
jgi:Skp family chaperone for outer membrane proteins